MFAEFLATWLTTKPSITSFLTPLTPPPAPPIYPITVSKAKAGTTGYYIVVGGPSATDDGQVANTLTTKVTETEIFICGPSLIYCSRIASAIESELINHFRNPPCSFTIDNRHLWVSFGTKLDEYEPKLTNPQGGQSAGNCIIQVWNIPHGRTAAISPTPP